MADDSMSLLETLRKVSAGGDIDLLREGVRLLAHEIMEAEVTEITGVAKGERDPEHRQTHRSRTRSTNPLERLNKEIQAPQRRGRGLPEPGERDPPRRDDPRRAGRRVAGWPLARHFRPETLAPIDARAPEEVGPALLMAS